MTITAEWIRNKDEFPWELVRASTGTTGLRTYLVNTDLVDKALTAAGLPAIDDAWDGLDFADLTVVQVGPAKVLGGKDISGNGDGGWCAVPVRYATPTRALAVFPQPGLKWTEIASGLEAFTGYFPLKRKTGPDPNTPNIDVPGPYQPSNNGDGFPVKQATYSARVHVYLEPDASYDAEALIALSRPCKVNDAPLTLPRIMGFPQLRWTLARGQVLYLTHEVVRDGPAMRITHHLEISNDFLFRWQYQDSKGRAVGGVVFDQVYQEANMSGLW